MISIHNLHIESGYKHEFLIDRSTPLGNPFSHLPDTRAQFKVSSRAEAITKYKQWLPEQVKAGNKPLISNLYNIYKTIKSGNTAHLMCWCRPKPCHGEVIREFLLKELSNESN